MQRPDIEAIWRGLEAESLLLTAQWDALFLYITDLERERDNAWDKYAEVCQEVGDLQKQLHEAREGFTDYAEEAGQKVADLKEQTESWKNVGDIWQTECKRLYERLAQAEKVVEAAWAVQAAAHGHAGSEQYRAAFNALDAALRAEWEGR